MKKKTDTLCYSVCVYFLIFRIVSAVTCSPDTIDVENKIKRGRALVGAVFWKGQIKDLTQCATACIRRKVCNSFNFDTWARVCELNVAVEGDMEFRNGTNGLVYSEIAGWLSELDPACASRPCTVNEVCIPGELGINGGTGAECSYICMASNLLCPKPYAGFSGDRRVGAIATTTCGTGEDYSAECLVTRKWNKTLNYCEPCTPSYDNAVMGSEAGVKRSFTCAAKYKRTDPNVAHVECVVDAGTGMASWSPASDICTALYRSACSVDDDCQDIQGICKDGTCQCPPGMPYDANRESCIQATCGSGWVSRDELCYLFVLAAEDFSASEQNCVSFNAHLVYINSQEENDFVITTVTGEVRVWIGMEDIEASPTTWTSGHAINFKNYDDDEPNFVDGDNVYCNELLASGKWNDMPCDQARSYVCKKHLYL